MPTDGLLMWNKMGITLGDKSLNACRTCFEIETNSRAQKFTEMQQKKKPKKVHKSILTLGNYPPD